MDKIYSFLNRSADRIIKKNFVTLNSNFKNRVFFGFIILIVISKAITTYSIGECINCDLTRTEAVNMLDISNPSDSELTNWYATRTYLPFNSVGAYLKAFLMNVTGPLIVYFLVYFTVYFIWRLLKSYVVSLKSNGSNIIKTIMDKFK